MTTEKLQPFEGIPKELPDFLWGLALHNEKPWFEAHRDEYERLLHRPVKALAAQVCQALNDRFPRAGLTTHISRIYRDARTLRGRGPYNDHMWFSLGRTGRVYAEEPQFYVGVEARCCDWGVGYWNVAAETMDRWRKSIDANPARLTRIVRRAERAGFVRYGEVYKRPKGDPGRTLFDWYNCKRPVVQKLLWFEPDVPGAELADALIEDFTQLMPLYEYFVKL